MNFQHTSKPAMNRRDLANYFLYAALILAIAAIFYYGGR